MCHCSQISWSWCGYCCWCCSCERRNTHKYTSRLTFSYLLLLSIFRRIWANRTQQCWWCVLLNIFLIYFYAENSLRPLLRSGGISDSCAAINMRCVCWQSLLSSSRGPVGFDDWFWKCFKKQCLRWMALNEPQHIMVIVQGLFSPLQRWRLPFNTPRRL